MVQVENCCGIMSLRTGSITAAVISMVVSVLGIVMLAVFWSDVLPDKELKMLIHDEDRSQVNTVITVSLAFGLLLFVVWLITSILLLVGILKNKPRLVTSWVIFTAVILCFSALGFISTFLTSFSGEAQAIEQTFLTAIQLGFLLYLLIVVVSYRRNMPTFQTYTAVAFTIPGNPYNPCELPPKYDA